MSVLADTQKGCTPKSVITVNSLDLILPSFLRSETSWEGKKWVEITKSGFSRISNFLNPEVFSVSSIKRIGLVMGFKIMLEVKKKGSAHSQGKWLMIKL
jgi:hypothetical protein